MRLPNIELHIIDKVNFDQFDFKIRAHAQTFQIIKLVHVFDPELMHCKTSNH